MARRNRTNQVSEDRCKDVEDFNLRTHCVFSREKNLPNVSTCQNVTKFLAFSKRDVKESRSHKNKMNRALSK